ncbi:MAG: transketolase [Patescibacteria group bacterium]
MSLDHELCLRYQELEKKANEIRQDVIQALANAGSGHSAGSLGMADVFTALYFSVLHIDPKNPSWPDRDRLVLSNAHICPVLYATLAHRGFCSRASFVFSLRKLSSPFQGHSNNHEASLGIETCGGPLGQGLSQAVGMALAARMDQATWHTFCLLSDGEMDEGQTWEAVMFAGNKRLHNLTAIVDRNNIQLSGFTEERMPLEPLADKWRAFNWHVLEVDGHNIGQIIDALNEAKTIYEKPTVIIAHTVPGKGVDFMEQKPEWHGRVPTTEEAKRALDQLRSSIIS